MYRVMTILRRWRLAWGSALLLVSASAGAQLLPGLSGGGPSLPSTPSLPNATGVEIRQIKEEDILAASRRMRDALGLPATLPPEAAP